MVINRLFGLPLVNYFDDLGSAVPTWLSEDGIRLLREACALFGVILGDRKTDLGRRIAFSGILGHFPGPDADMVLPITLSGEKKTHRIAIIRNVSASGRISNKDSESLTGKYHFPQTSIFGRFGRVTVHPIYRKLYAAYYQPILTDSDRITLSRRGGVLSKQHRRAASKRNPFPDFIIYTDAAASAMIMSIIVLFRSDFMISQRIAHCCGIRASGAWIQLFRKRR